MSTLLLTCCRDTQSNQHAIVKSAPGFLLDNEHDILQRFQKFSSLRYLIDQVQDPSLLVLEYLDSNLLVESAAKKVTVQGSRAGCKGHPTSPSIIARGGHCAYG
jgi:hypothetical protein